MWAEDFCLPATAANGFGFSSEIATQFATVAKLSTVCAEAAKVVSDRVTVRLTGKTTESELAKWRPCFDVQFDTP